MFKSASTAEGSTGSADSHRDSELGSRIRSADPVQSERSVNQPPAAVQSKNTARLSLEVMRGSTQFRIRPIHSNRFLIGSGSFCDLRLGGEDTPVIHSIIRQDNQEVWIHVMVAAPPLVVNGVIKHSETLGDGDIIHVGCFDFRVRISMQPPKAVSPNLVEHHEFGISKTVISETDAGPCPEDLSAIELVDRIEQEQKLVEQFEPPRESGARALLQAVTDRVAELTEADSSQTFPDAELIPQIETVVGDLDRFHASLQEQSRILEQREISHAQAASTLLEIQDRMADALEFMVQQMGLLQEKRAQPTKRIA